jgi:hypothetical protein
MSCSKTIILCVNGEVADSNLHSAQISLLLHIETPTQIPAQVNLKRGDECLGTLRTQSMRPFNVFVITWSRVLHQHNPQLHIILPQNSQLTVGHPAIISNIKQEQMQSHV